MTDMIKRREACFQLELQKAKNCCEHCYNSFINSEINYNRGFDAGVAEMQAQIDELNAKCEFRLSCFNSLRDELDIIKKERDQLKSELEAEKQNKAHMRTSYIKGLLAEIEAKDAQLDAAVTAMKRVVNHLKDEAEPEQVVICKEALEQIQKMRGKN